MVDCDQAVAEDEGGVRGIGAVGVGPTGLGLQLVAEVADQAAIEVEGKVVVGDPQSLQLSLDRREDRISLSHLIGEELAERTGRPEERKPRPVPFYRGVEPKRDLRDPR